MDLVKELALGNVHMKDPERINNMVKGMAKNGHERLQVIADFDRTLSKYMHEGKECATCHNVLEESRLTSEDFKRKALELRRHYYAIELDHSLSMEEKTPHMIEWYTKGHDLLVTDGLCRDDIRISVQESSSRLRDGCQEFFDSLHKAEIPLLIFSAGIGDIIEEIIRQQSKMYDNMKVVSNYMDFDEQGKLIGFKGELIHVYNKNENAIHSSSYFEDIRHRDNILLLGDSLGDLRMAEGAEDVQHVLKIGFLNNKVEELLPTYKEHFDVVIVEDPSLDVVNAITHHVLNSRS